MKPVLSVKNLHWQYPSGFKLKNISFDLMKGERWGIIGPNGSGKSTFIKLLLKIQKPPLDSLFLDGIDIRKMKQTDLAREISYVPQITPDTDGFKVEEIIRMGRYPYGNGHSEYDDQVIESLLDRLHLKNLRNRNTSALSGGERQRILLARSLAQETKLILLDEPTNHLDLSRQLLILRLLKEEQKKRDFSVLSVFHDLNQAFSFCDRIILMNQGEAVITASPENLVENTLLDTVYELDFTRNQVKGSSIPYLIPDEAL